MCFDFNFTASKWESEPQTGDIAMITKLAPTGLAGGARELFTDADTYTLAFNPANGLTPAQKVTTLSAQLLIDYMIFDGQMSKFIEPLHF